MKKIVGIIAAVAMATSVFAADVAAKVNILGSLFAFDTSNGEMTALGIAEGGQGWNPSFQMSVSGDDAGASMKFYDNKGKDGAVSSVDYNIWFKPFSILTVQVGNWSTNLNQETIDYSNTASGIDTDGYALCLNTNGFEFDVFFTTPWSDSNFAWNRWTGVKGWLSKANNNEGTKAAISETYIKVAYGADFGTISAYADLKTAQGWTDWGNGGVVVPCDGADFGIGYTNTFGNVKMFFNGIAGFDSDFNFGIFRGELFGSTSIGSCGISAFLVGGYANDKKTDIAQDKLANIPAGTKPGAFFGMTAKVTFPLGGFGGYVYLKDDNFIVDNFSMEAKIGATKNVGACSIDLAADLYLQSEFKMDIPVVFTVAW